MLKIRLRRMGQIHAPFYRVIGNFKLEDKSFSGEWRAVEGSPYFMSPKLYKENGFKEMESANRLIDHLMEDPSGDAKVESIERKKENKNPPLLYNLAEPVYIYGFRLTDILFIHHELYHSLIQAVDCQFIHREKLFNSSFRFPPGCTAGCHLGIQPNYFLILFFHQLQPFIS